MIRTEIGAPCKAPAKTIGWSRAGEVAASLSSLFAMIVIASAALAASSFASQEAYAQGGATIREVHVQGSRRLEAESVISFLAFKAGDRVDAVKIDESLKALFATGLFRDARIDIANDVAVVTVVENPLIRRVVFEGNSEVKSDELAGLVQLKAGYALTKARTQLGLQAILERYRREGFYAAQVEPKTIDAGQNRIDLVFEIREGPKGKVAAINFVGSRAFSDTELRAVISARESGLLDFLKSGTVYDADRLNLDRELLRRHYLKSGFADMRVVSAFADMDPDGKRFFLTFTIDEGPRYTFDSLDVQVTSGKLDATALRKSIVGRDGDIYNAESIEQTVEALAAAAAAQGEPFAQARPRVERDPVRRTIAVTYVVERGPSLYIERIDIAGNHQTQTPVILRELRLVEGDAYNKAMADRARERLLRLGFFKEVRIERRSGSAPDRVILAVTVEEQATGEVSFAVGYSSNEGVIGEVAYTERNFMGTGQYLQVKLNGSFVSGGATVSWTEPRFLDRNMSFGVDAFIKNTDYTAASGYTVAGYKDLRAGGVLRLGLPITDELSIAPNTALTWDKVYHLDPNASLAVKQIQGSALISSVGYSLIYDTRNNKKKPTRGFYFVGTQDFAGAGGDVNYIRSTAELRGYYPITSDITLAGRALGGTITGWGGQNVRIVDAFYKGSETIRGFQSAGLGPRDGATGDALGGTTFYSASAEVRFPLPFLPQDLGLGGAVFTDAGSLFGTDAQKFAQAYVAQHGGKNTLTVQNSVTLRSSAGASLVWDSPIGPLRADFSGIISKAPFDKSQTFGFGYTGW